MEIGIMKISRLLLLICALLLTPNVWAYLDPGTGSMLLQVVLGGIAAIGVALKIFWHRIKLAMGLGRKSGSGGEAD
jgi:hypothetical protein